MEPVIVYSADGCQFCEEAKAILDEKQIPFIERNIDENPEYLREAKRLGNRWLPILVFQDSVLVSPTQDELISALDSLSGDR